MWSTLLEEISKYQSSNSNGIIEMFNDLSEEACILMLDDESPNTISWVKKNVPQKELYIHMIIDRALNQYS
ncbi:MAG: hypothetical protein WC716_11365 [Chitinophagaceae bacterium]|jgi:hypothetical protein